MRAWMKYWLMAVNSAVRMSLRTVRTRGSPLTQPSPGDGRSARTIRRLQGLLNEPEDHHVTGPAIAASAALVHDLVQGARARANDGLDAGLGRAAAEANNHGAVRIP